MGTETRFSNYYKVVIKKETDALASNSREEKVDSKEWKEGHIQLKEERHETKA